MVSQFNRFLSHRVNYIELSMIIYLCVNSLASAMVDGYA